MFIEFFKKLVKSIKSMITEDNIAAAQMAQIFGSELLKVQQSVSDSRMHPDIVKLNPKHFLVGEEHYKNQQKAHDHRVALALQREAEIMHPLPQTFQPPVTNTPPAQPQIASTPSIQSFSSQPGDPLHRIAASLERIANKLDHVDIKPKRKTIKRKPKSNKTILLHENHV